MYAFCNYIESPKIPSGKKLIYTQIDLPLAAILDFEELGKTDPLFAELDRLCKANNGLWNPEAESTCWPTPRKSKCHTLRD